MSEEGPLPFTGTEKSGFFYGYVIIAIVFIILVILYGTLYTFGIFFKPLAGEFGWTSVATSGAFSMYMVLYGLFSTVTGRLNDKLGPRVILTGSGLLLGSGYLLMSRINAIWQLYLFYGVIVSLGMSGGFVPLTSTVPKWFLKKRGLMNGIAVSGAGIGTMVMPPVASWLISTYGWRISYMVIGILAWVIILPAAQFLKRDPLQLRLLPYGYHEARAERSGPEDTGSSTREAISGRQFWLLCLSYFGFGIFLQAIMVHIVPHATGLGTSATAAATIFIAVGGLSILGRIGTGSFSDRLGNRPALIISLVLMTAALVWLLVAKEMWQFYLFAVVFGLAYGGIVAVESPIVAELFGLRSHGALLGIIVCMVTLGGAIGSAMAGGVFDITGSYSLAFIICGIISFLSLVLASLLKPVRNGREK